MRKQLLLTAVLALTGVSSAAAQTQPLTITSLVPPSTPAGSPAFTLGVNGTGFLPLGCNSLPQSLIVWNGADQTTSYLSGTSLSAPIPATAVAAAGSASLSDCPSPSSFATWRPGSSLPAR